MDLASGMLQYQRQQEALTLDKQKVQDNAMLLQQKAYGIKQQQAEDAAIRQFDPSNLDSLQTVAGTLAQGGNSQAAISVLSEYQKLKDQQMMAQTRAVTQRGTLLKTAGGIVTGMVESPAAYQTGLTQLMSSGINPSSIGLTGSYEQDKERIPQIAQSSMTAFQQGELATKQATDARLQYNEQMKLQQEQTRNSLEERRVRADEGRLAASEQREQEKSKMDQLAQSKYQAGINAKKAQLAVPTKDMQATVYASLQDDPRTENASDQELKALTTRLAYKASQKRAAKYDPQNPASEGDDNTYLDDVSTELDTMIKKGEWGKKSSFTLLHPLSGVTGKLQPPTQASDKIPTIKTEQDYAAIPSGAEYISPDGKKRRKP